MRYALTLLFLFGCGGPAVPAGVVCDGTVTGVGDDAALTAALQAAQPGDCIVLAQGAYTGPVVAATARLTLTAEEGARVEVSSAHDGIRIEQQAIVHALHVRSAARHGVVITGAGSTYEQSEILEAGEAGVMIKCEDAGCMERAGRIGLDHVAVSGAQYGLFVQGADVLVSASAFTGSQGEGIGGGAGVYAVAGASLELQGSRIADNVYGLIADGANTRVLVVDTEVANNSDLGVWGQHLRGSMSTPGLELRGAGTRIDGNGVTGLGAFDAAGIVVQDAQISATVEKDVLVDLINRVRIGDGVSLLSQTRAVRIAGARLADNRRAQAVVDAAGIDIVFDATNTVSGGRHPIVVQASTEVVQVPPAQLATGVGMLGVQLLGLPVPPVMP